MVEVLHLKNIRLPSVNNKYGLDKRRSRLFLLDGYREFKETVALHARHVLIPPPYRISIYMETTVDYDNVLKPIGDGLKLAGVIDDDKHILEATITKKPVKRNTDHTLVVWLETITEGA